MSEETRWRAVVTDGKERTALWFGEAATRAEAEALALAEHPGWHVQECDHDLLGEPRSGTDLLD